MITHENPPLFTEMTNGESETINGQYRSCGYRYAIEVVYDARLRRYVTKNVLRYRCHWV
jgi:hypothetical protein